ncbi:MAG TPA: DUF2274 domain-containing protein [Steroidobacteraceae bacterium]
MKLRLGPLPNTQTVKLTITVSRDLKEQLERYAELHSAAWNEPVDVPTLIPHMLSQFISHDRVFRRALKGRGAGRSGSAGDS